MGEVVQKEVACTENKKRERKRRWRRGSGCADCRGLVRDGEERERGPSGRAAPAGCGQGEQKLPSAPGSRRADGSAAAGQVRCAPPSGPRCSWLRFHGAALSRAPAGIGLSRRAQQTRSHGETPRIVSTVASSADEVGQKSGTVGAAGAAGRSSGLFHRG